MNEDKVIWKDNIQARYGDSTLKNYKGLEASTNKKASIWWRDVMSASRFTLENKPNMDTFIDKVIFMLGLGNTVPFWIERWIMDKTLK